jgi:hypothetical protein
LLYLLKLKFLHFFSIFEATIGVAPMQLRASLFVVEFKDVGVAELCGFTLSSWFFIPVADGG